MSAPTLVNLRVIDLSHRVSGPYCTRLLANWGAEVIKVEIPGEGDGARDSGPFPDNLPDQEKSALFLYLNTGKKSITLNLKTATGADLLKRLVKDADVLVENFEPRVLPGLALDYSVLSKINPSLVMTSISSFGQTGPYRDYRTASIVSYAMGGQMWVCGENDREPLNSAPLIPQYMGGLYAFIGTMMALQSRQVTGKGQHVDTSIMECLAGSHQYTLTWPEYSDTLLVRPGWPGAYTPPSFFLCKDGYVNMRLQAIDMALLAYLFEMPELASDERFQAVETRAVHIEELKKIVAEKLAGMTKRNVFLAAGEWHSLCGFVATPGDLLSDPEYAERRYWADVEHPVAGKFAYPGAPVKMTESPWLTGPAPLVGQHNVEIYCDRLGLTREELVRLRAAGVV